MFAFYPMPTFDTKILTWKIAGPPITTTFNFPLQKSLNDCASNMWISISGLNWGTVVFHDDHKANVKELANVAYPEFPFNTDNIILV